MANVFLIGGTRGWNRKIDSLIIRHFPRGAKIGVIAAAAFPDPNPKYNHLTYFTALKKHYAALGAKNTFFD